MNTDGKWRLHAHESEGRRGSCSQCEGTGHIDTPSYEGRCLRCDGAGETVCVAAGDDNATPH